jgi:hypothetical protein
LGRLGVARADIQPEGRSAIAYVGAGYHGLKEGGSMVDAYVD